MLIQPFVENAVLHGIAPKEEKGHIEIKFEVIQKQLKCTVKDDGIGRRKARQIDKMKHHRSSGVSITQERLMILNNAKQLQGCFEIIDLEDESPSNTGTIVIFKLPVQKLKSINQLIQTQAYV